MYHKRIKYINVHYNTVRDIVTQGEIIVQKISAEDKPSWHVDRDSSKNKFKKVWILLKLKDLALLKLCWPSQRWRFVRVHLVNSLF